MKSATKPDSCAIKHRGWAGKNNLGSTRESLFASNNRWAAEQVDAETEKAASAVTNENTTDKYTKTIESQKEKTSVSNQSVPWWKRGVVKNTGVLADGECGQKLRPDDEPIDVTEQFSQFGKKEEVPSRRENHR